MGLTRIQSMHWFEGTDSSRPLTFLLDGYLAYGGLVLGGEYIGGREVSVLAVQTFLGAPCDNDASADDTSPRPADERRVAISSTAENARHQYAVLRQHVRFVPPLSDCLVSCFAASFVLPYLCCVIAGVSESKTGA